MASIQIRIRILLTHSWNIGRKWVKGEKLSLLSLNELSEKWAVLIIRDIFY